MTGHGKAVVCAVGNNTLLARLRGKEEFHLVQETQTHLDHQLDAMAKQISKYAVIIMAFSVLSHLLFLMLFVLYSEVDLISNRTLLEAANIGIIAVVIMIVAIPEGLPLSVSLAMSFSVNKLKNEQILIKNVESVQQMAMCHEICVSKTGCLTKSEMRVGKFQLLDSVEVHDHGMLSGSLNYFNTRLELNLDIKQIIKESLISNTDVRVEENDETMMYEPKGQELEVAMIKFLIDNDEDIHASFIRRNRYSPKLCQMPFDQDLKRKTVVRRVAENANLVRIYVKGAPECVIPICNQTIDGQNQPINLDDNKKQQLLEDAVSSDMASKGLKVISYSFKEIDVHTLNELMCNFQVESAEFRE